MRLCAIKRLDNHALDTTNQQNKFNQYHSRSRCNKTSPSDTCMHQLWGNMCMVMHLSYLSGGQQLEHCVKRTIILVRCHHHCCEQVFIHVDFIIRIGWAFWSVLCCLWVLLSSLRSCSLTSLQQFFILQLFSSNGASTLQYDPTLHQPHYPWEVTFLKNTIDG